MINAVKKLYLLSIFGIVFSSFSFGSSSTPAPSQTPQLSSEQNSLSIAIKSGKYSADTKDFYIKNNFTAVWFKTGSPTKAQKIAVDILKDCETEGLNPIDYVPEFSNDWVENELKLTESFLKFIDHVRVGRVSPGSVARTIKVKSEKTTPPDLLLKALSTLENYELLYKMAPDLPDYHKLKKLLASYRQMAQSTKEWPSIKNKNSLKIGMEDDSIIKAKQLLILLGDLDETKADLTSKKFDKALDEAVRSFQERHTLEADGVVGGKTKDTMNWSIQTLINKIIVNMERLRWFPDEMGERYIQVNVGGYEVTGIENNNIALRIPAIIGKVSTKTPLFYAKVKNVIINPSWGVPTSIMMRDKLPKILKDRDYVRRAGFTVYDSSGAVIDPDQADWEGSGASYRLRQSPGSHNALGRIKLNIENPYTIYMHGTPEEKLFQKASRGFSSGCIRLKDPVEMANWTLKNLGNWDKEKIQAAIKKGGTQTINLTEKIPVYLTYLTAWIDDNNRIHFSDDLYKMDEPLMKLLKLV